VVFFSKMYYGKKQAINWVLGDFIKVAIKKQE
jgi:hypothetical protein